MRASRSPEARPERAILTLVQLCEKRKDKNPWLAAAAISVGWASTVIFSLSASRPRLGAVLCAFLSRLLKRSLFGEALACLTSHLSNSVLSKAAYSREGGPSSSSRRQAGSYGTDTEQLN